jgi:hypothetical protein
MRRRFLLAGFVLGSIFALLAAAAPTRAADAPETKIFGPIQRVEGDHITARNENGASVSFRATGRIVSNQPVRLDFLKPGLSVALDTRTVAGRLVVTHVHTQEWARAPGTYGTRPLNSDASVTRHLGRIASVEPIAGGVRMKVTHEGGKTDVTVDVPQNVPVLYHNREERPAQLKPGMLVMATATPGEGGVLQSGFVTVEVPGARPVRIPD